MLAETTGPVPIEVPRDRDGSFEPQIAKKRQRRLTGVDEIVLSLYAKGLTPGEISMRFPAFSESSECGPTGPEGVIRSSTEEVPR